MRGRTVVLAWELGAGWGHAAPLAAAARRLAADGARVVLALRDVAGTRPLTDGGPWTVVQAPAPEPVAARRRLRAASYGDTLALYGFDDPDLLGPLIDAWRDLFARTGAELVIADHGPGAGLAARGRLPVVRLGNGFTEPPAHLDEFPALAPDVPAVVPQGRLLERINAVLAAKGTAPLDRLPALAEAPARLLYTIAWADPYAAVRRDPYLGPLEPLPALNPRPAERRLYAYVNAWMPRFRPATAAFAATNAERRAFVRGADATMRRRLAGRGVALCDRPPPLGEIVPWARALMTNATAGLSLAALAAGRPQVAIPLHLEAAVTARLLGEHGAVLVPSETGAGPAVRRALEAALSDPALDERAAAAARAMPRIDPEAALARVAAACAGALDRGADQ